MTIAKRVSTVILCAVLCILVGMTLCMYINPMSDRVYDLSVLLEGNAEWDDKGWTVFTQVGNNGRKAVLTPDYSGGYDGLSYAGQTFYYSRTMTENLKDATLRIGSTGRSIAVFLDDELIYSDCPELDNRIGCLTLPTPTWERSENLVITLPNDYTGKVLTIAQSTSELGGEIPGKLTVWPCEITLSCGYAYESGLIAESFRTALPAVLCFALGAVLLVFFIYSYFRKETDWGMLWATVGIFLLMAGLLFSASFLGRYYAIPTNMMQICRSFAVFALILFLSTRAGKGKSVLWILGGLHAFATAVCLFIDITGADLDNAFIIFLRIDFSVWTGIFGLLTAVILGAAVWYKAERFYKLYTWFMAGGFILWTLVSAVYFMTDAGETARILFFGAVKNFSVQYFLWRLEWLSMFAGIAAALYTQIETRIAHRIETKLLGQRVEMGLEAYEALRNQNEQILLLRHDMLKHLRIIRQLAETDEEREKQYLDGLIGENEKIRPVIRSGNVIIDEILNSTAREAERKGVSMIINRCQAPKRLPLTDAELCSLIMNFMDNAVTAASESEEKRVEVDMHCKGDFFVFICENSWDKNTPKANTGNPEAGHGYGLKIIGQITKKYGNLMVVEKTDKIYRVTLPIPLGNPIEI